MRKKTIKKLAPFEHQYGFQTNLLDVEEEMRIYMRRRCLSSMPPNSTPEKYPFSEIGNGLVVPHEIFKPIFKGKQLVMTTIQANRLFATRIGFDIKSGLPCLIDMNNKDTYLIKLFPPYDPPYIVDYMGKRIEQ